MIEADEKEPTSDYPYSGPDDIDDREKGTNNQNEISGSGKRLSPFHQNHLSRK